jgi:hypothetical protein
MLSQDNAEAEAKMWDCFAEVFEQEVSLAAAGVGAALKHMASTRCLRQFVCHRGVIKG